VLLKTLKSFGEGGVKPLEIKATWRVKFSLLKVERPFHCKTTYRILSFPTENLYSVAIL